jgi:hypothetical protein
VVPRPGRWALSVGKVPLVPRTGDRACLGLFGGKFDPWPSTKQGQFSNTQDSGYKLKLSDFSVAEHDSLRKPFGTDVVFCCEVSGGQFFPDPTRMPAVSLTIHAEPGLHALS